MAHVMQIHTARSWFTFEADPRAKNETPRELRSTIRRRRGIPGEAHGTTKVTATINRPVFSSFPLRSWTHTQIFESDFGCRSFPIQIQTSSCNPEMLGHIQNCLHVKMVTYDCLHRAGCSHGVIHSFFDGHSPCRVPCVHDAVDQSKFRIIDPLQSTVSVGGRQ